MKKIFVVLAALLLLSIVACGGGNTSTSQTSASTEVLNSYTKALKAGDTTKAVEYVSEAAKDKQKKALDLMNQDSRQRLADALLSASKEYEDDNAIKYRGTMTLPDGSKVEDTFWMILENGSWKITGL